MTKPTVDSKGRRLIPSIVDMTQRKVTTASLKNYGLNGVVTMQWHMSPEMKEDRIFKLSIGEETAILDVEEILAYIRLV
jgi:hypothetical protein